jgi:Tol biopolymer transport system component
MPVPRSIVSGLCVVVACGCAGSAPTYDEPMGVLPSAVTSAEALFVPFVFLAGKSRARDEREVRLDELRQLTFDGKSASPTWHPDGRAIVFTSLDERGCGRLKRLDLRTGALSDVLPAAPSSVGCAADPVVVAPKGDGHPSVIFAFAPGDTPCGAPARPIDDTAKGASRSKDCDLLLLLLDGTSSPRPVTQSPRYDGNPDAARDGRLAFTSERDGDPELYVTSQGSLRRLTRTRGYDGGARFSPDGSKLVWTAPRTGDAYDPPGAQLVIAGAEGQHPRPLAAVGESGHAASFLADSRRLLFASDDDAPPGDTSGKHLDLYLVDPDGPATQSGGPRVERVTYHEGYDGQARLSPDGRWLAFVSSRGSGPDAMDLFVARFRDEESSQ